MRFPTLSKLHLFEVVLQGADCCESITIIGAIIAITHIKLSIFTKLLLLTDPANWTAKFNITFLSSLILNRIT